MPLYIGGNAVSIAIKNRRVTNEEKITLEKTDNFAYSEMVFSLPTGSESIIYILIAIMIVTTLGVGIVLIKKYVTK